MTNSTTKKKPSSRKVGQQIRVDPGTHQRLTEASKALGISLNSLAEGILVWAMREGHYHPNQDVRTDFDIADTCEREGYIWFGEEEKFSEYVDKHGHPILETPAYHHFSLDFSPQGSIRTASGKLLATTEPNETPSDEAYSEQQERLQAKYEKLIDKKLSAKSTPKPK